MTLVPSPIPMSMVPAPTSGIRSASIFVLELDLETGVGVVAVLLGQVELARTGRSGCSRGRRPARWAPRWRRASRWRRSAMSRRRRAARSCAPVPQAATRSAVSKPATARRMGVGRDDGTMDLRLPGRWASGPRRAGARRGRRRDTGDARRARSSASVANMQRGVEQRPAGEVDEDAEALARRRPTRRRSRRRPRGSRRRAGRRRCSAGRPGSRAWSGSGGGSRGGCAAELDQPRVDRADADHRRDRDREEHDQRADDDLAARARARTTGRAAARGRGSGRPGRRRGRARRARSTSVAAREPVADERARARPRRTNPSDDLDDRRRDVRPDRPVQPGRDEPRRDRLRAAAG